MDENQGNPEEVAKPSSEEKLAEMKQEAQTLAERSKTVDERLAQVTQPQKAEEPVKVEQPEPMPSSNQTQTEEPTALPESASERTKEQFEKILEENRRLKEERRKQAGESVFDSLRPQQQPVIDMNQFGNLNTQQTQQITQSFVYPDGTVDIDGLNKALTLANDRATIAETESRITRDKLQQFDERQQVREAHKDFPELDPARPDTFDPNFYDLVTVKLAKSGMKMTLAEAAAEVKKTYGAASTTNLDKVRDEAINQYKDSLKKRDQAPLSTSQGDPRTVESNKDLREKTRKGDPFALDERLRALGLIK